LEKRDITFPIEKQVSEDSMSKTIRKAPRSGIAIAMVARFGGGDKPMKDRRTPRQGARNKQREYREENY
jgi:hypothetical protein